METLDNLKTHWESSSPAVAAYDETSMHKIIKSRVSKNLKTSMQYFWASFALQILVYAMFSHVIIKYNDNSTILLLGFAGILLFVPFTIVLMRKFKRMAITNINTTAPSSIHDYVYHQRKVLESFFNFKKRYEMILIPLSAAIGVFLTFTLYVQGGIYEHLSGSLIIYTLTLLSCYVAIRSENRKSFILPLQQLDMILKEYASS